MTPKQRKEQIDLLAQEWCAIWASLTDFVLGQYLEARDKGDTAGMAKAMARGAVVAVEMGEAFAESVELYTNNDIELVGECSDAADVMFTVIDNKVHEYSKKLEAVMTNDGKKLLKQCLN